MWARGSEPRNTRTTRKARGTMSTWILKQKPTGFSGPVLRSTRKKAADFFSLSVSSVWSVVAAVFELIGQRPCLSAFNHNVVAAAFQFTVSCLILNRTIFPFLTKIPPALVQHLSSHRPRSATHPVPLRIILPPSFCPPFCFELTRSLCTHEGSEEHSLLASDFRVFSVFRG